jgi:hypothetical protein
MRDPPPPGPEEPAAPPPQPAQPAAPQPAPPQPKKATFGKDSNGVSYVVFENEIRWGGTRHAPPSENDTEGYIKHVVSWTNNGSGIGKCEITKAKNLISDQTAIKDISDKASFAMAMARQEGWCDVNAKKEIYNCQSKKTPAELKPMLSCP